MRIKIKYENLRIEMARKEVEPMDMTRLLGVDRVTTRSKLMGKTQFSLKEALKIQAAFFPDCELRDLFKELMEDE